MGTNQVRRSEIVRTGKSFKCIRKKITMKESTEKNTERTLDHWQNEISIEEAMIYQHHVIEGIENNRYLYLLNVLAIGKYYFSLLNKNKRSKKEKDLSKQKVQSAMNKLNNKLKKYEYLTETRPEH